MKIIQMINKINNNKIYKINNNRKINKILRKMAKNKNNLKLKIKMIIKKSYKLY